MHHEVVAAIIVQSQKILLGLRSPAREFYPNVWDVFGGHVEPGEKHSETLVRELQEELGITPTEWNYLETITSGTEADPLTLYLYLVTTWTGTPSNRQLEEHSKIDWFALEEAVVLPLAHSSYPEFFGRYLGG